MRGPTHRLAAGAGVALAVSALLFTSTPAASATNAQPGAPGVGDSLFPNLGNGGYDATAYDVYQRYPTLAPVQDVPQSLEMKAQATQDLSSFNLDYAGKSLGEVLVNDRPATIDWQRGEITVTPAQPIRQGQRFTVKVDYVSGPAAAAPDNPYPVGWVGTEHGSFTSFQPNLAHDYLPVNDHPSDKARWRFTIDVPAGVTAVTNGVKTGERTANGRTVFTYYECSPLATELIQIAVGTDLTVKPRDSVAGVQYRDVIAQGPQAQLETAFSKGPAQLQWVIDKIGKFPHSVYGNLGIDLRFGYALETQGLSLHSEGLFSDDYLPGRTGQEWFYSSVMVHEIAHEWYGNSVSPAMWSDLWLNEGWATYFMKLWEVDKDTIDDWGYASLDDYMKDVYRQGDIWRAAYGPVARPSAPDTLFSENVYDGGALVLYALKQQVGDVAFQKIMRGWPSQNKDSARSTDDFIAFASRTSGKDLRNFMRAWVYGETTPPMPGHPDWTTEPVTAAAATTSATTEQPLSQYSFGLAR